MFKSIGHFFTAMIQYTIKGAHALEAAAPKVIAIGQTIENITKIVYPAAAPLEDLMLRTFGDVVGAAHTTAAAAGAKFVDIQLDIDLYNELRAIVPDILAFASMIGAQKPAEAPKPSLVKS